MKLKLDMSVLCLYPESFYTKEQIKEIIANLMNGDKSIVIGTIYDAELIKGFNKFNLNVGATDGRMLYALIKDDELGEVINNLEIYLNNNNRHIEDIPRPIIVENIKPNKFIRTREI